MQRCRAEDNNNQASIIGRNELWTLKNLRLLLIGHSTVPRIGILRLVEEALLLTIRGKKVLLVHVGA